ncbi:MAG: hypothetical protein NVS9B3_09070 [Gemmatimonadaceae bacterium]
MLFRRSNRPTWYLEVATPHRTARRSTGLHDEGEARAFERALTELARRHDWELVEAWLDNRLSATSVREGVAHGEVELLRRAARDADIAPAVVAWEGVLRGRVALDTVHHYLHAVRTLIPEGAPFPRSRLTGTALRQWLAAYPGQPATVRKAHAAMTQLVRYLVAQRVIADDPLRGVRPPAAPAGRCRWLEVAELIRLAGKTQRPYHTLSALLGGTGLELSIALGLRASDVDIRRKEIRAPGTRAHARDRIVRVAEWAWPYLIAHVARLRPEDPLFPNTDRWRAQAAHAAACRELGLEDYTLRDQRHSYAVRAARAGTPASVIARQLGHANPALVLKVYAPFMPGQDERDKWERIAAMQDAERDRARAVDVEWCMSHEPYKRHPVPADAVGDAPARRQVRDREHRDTLSERGTRHALR